MSKELMITPDLRATVESHPNIKEVHFTQVGHHYFNVHEYKGKKYGRIDTVNILNEKTNKPVPVQSPMLNTLIVKTLTRKEICE